MNKIKKITFHNCIKWQLTDSEYLHRIDGPAIEYSNGIKEWWVDGWRVLEMMRDRELGERKFKHMVARFICYEE